MQKTRKAQPRRSLRWKLDRERRDALGDIPPRIVNADGSVKHIARDGARYHILSWSTQGTHCSEPDCEINRRRKDV
jgi:hypothetical protein